MSYDIIIPVTQRNIKILEQVVLYLKKNVPHKNIFLIGSAFLKDLSIINKCKFIDEDELIEGLSYKTIKQLIIQRDQYSGKRAGWYLQQFLKMSYSLICHDNYYLVWDADTIPVKKIRMFDEEGHPYFDVKDEYHKPYFTTIRKIFNSKIRKKYSFSYISEHMIINTDYMRKLIFEIENNQLLDGIYYFEKIINSIHTVDLMHSGFSEFETYGNYVSIKYPDEYKIRRLKSLRSGDRYLHYPPTKKEMQWAADSYSIITMENRQKMYANIEVNIEQLIKNCTLEEIVNQYNDK